MKRFSIKYEKGGEIQGVLLEEAAPKICKMFWDNLPMETVSFHTRWSGRQVPFVPTWKEKPVMENQTLYVGLGDVCYYREWDGLYDVKGVQVLTIGWGAEHLEDERGEAKVNLFGRIDPQYWGLLQQIGERIWKHGEEKITVKAL